MHASYTCIGLLEFHDNEYRSRFQRSMAAFSVWLLKGPPDTTGEIDAKAQQDTVYIYIYIYIYKYMCCVFCDYFVPFVNVSYLLYLYSCIMLFCRYNVPQNWS